MSVVERIDALAVALDQLVAQDGLLVALLEPVIFGLGFVAALIDIWWERYWINDYD